jgi:chromosome segregation ATPase
MGSGTRCRSQKSLAKRAQRPQAQISSQWAQISKQRAVLEAKRNAVTTDVNKWLELKERIRCQVRDVRKRDKALEDRRREHQRERETVMTVAAQLPAKLDNQAYLTAQVAHRLENIADRLPSSGSSSKLLAMMLAIRSLCGQLKEAQAPEAGSKRTISDVSQDISMRLDGMEALLSRGEWENNQLRVVAKDAEESARHVHATAAVMVKLAGDHK